MAVPHPAAPAQIIYRLRVEGRLDEIAFDYIENLTLGLAVRPGAPEVTTLTCALPHQEALVGLINLLHDFGLPLLSLDRLTAQSLGRGEAAAAD